MVVRHAYGIEVEMMRRIVVLASALTLLLLATVGAQTNTTIVAGQSVAGIRIGGNVNDAIAALGSLFDREDTGSGKFSVYDWPLRPFIVIAEKESGRVVLVSVSLTDQFRTDKGVTGGSERQAVETAYGREFEAADAQAATRIIYDGQGIAFFVGKFGVMSGRVMQILVFAPGQWKVITEGL